MAAVSPSYAGPIAPHNYVNVVGNFLKDIRIISPEGPASLKGLVRLVCYVAAGSFLRPWCVMLNMGACFLNSGLGSLSYMLNNRQIAKATSDQYFDTAKKNLIQGLMNIVAGYWIFSWAILIGMTVFPNETLSVTDSVSLFFEKLICKEEVQKEAHAASKAPAIATEVSPAAVRSGS